MSQSIVAFLRISSFAFLISITGCGGGSNSPDQAGADLASMDLAASEAGAKDLAMVDLSAPDLAQPDLAPACRTDGDCPSRSNTTFACSSGVCVITSCATGFADCNNDPADGCEVSKLDDLANCGACGQACSFANAVAVCRTGVCAIDVCNGGYDNCDGVLANGCETATLTDSNNCGTCSHVCTAPNSTQKCAGGTCAIATCATGFADCNGMVADGCETKTGTDPMNCSSCGKVCTSAPNTAVSCVNAQCIPGECKMGFADCNGVAADGCEATLASDVNNCGLCGKKCPLIANGTAACGSGTCAIGKCDALWGDCDSSLANGCEKPLGTDVNNCGACGNACRFANAMPACLNGQCGILACSLGYADCDGDPTNGCEVATSMDAANCGACGNKCTGATATCSLGKCVATSYAGEWEWNWSVSSAPTQTMVPDNGGNACFLLMSTGAFRSSSQSVAVNVAAGQWVVAGMNAGQAISGRGGCITSIPGVTTESSWCVGQAPIALGSASDRACFLTRMSGAFNGGGEHIETYVAGGQWYLGGGAGTNSVCASARCVLNMTYSAETVWGQSDSSAHVLDVEAGHACFLTGVSGAYYGGGEIVAVYRQNGSWYVGGGSLQSGVSARARCLSF